MDSKEKNQRQTVVYLRNKSVQPSSLEVDSLPKKGAPIGAIAYKYSDGVLEVAFALQHSKQDRWDSVLCRRIVQDRLEKKRETCTHQVKTKFGVEFNETLPKYIRLNVSPPEGGFRPYDVLNLLKESIDSNSIKVPGKLERIINQMLRDNELRTKRLSELAERREEKIELMGLRVKLSNTIR